MVKTLLFVTLWSSLVAGGFLILSGYANTPGDPGRPAVTWPKNMPLAPSGRDFTLVMLVHPQCPCSRASISELERIMTEGGEKLGAIVLFYYPDSEPESWTHTDLWSNAAAIPNVRVFSDTGGQTARLFGARTSGMTALYDGGGHLLFSGGITVARGHEGDNDGHDAVIARIRGMSGPETNPVFGCHLFGEKS